MYSLLLNLAPVKSLGRKQSESWNTFSREYLECLCVAVSGGGKDLKKAFALLRLCVFCFPLIPFEEVVNTTLEFPQQEERGQEERH